jgi:hypothetical protein
MENAMEPVKIAKSAVHTIWTHKSLWLFGFFVAAGAGTGATRGTGVGKPPLSIEGAHATPAWVFALIAVGVVLALVGLLVNVVSDAALIDGVRRSRASEPVTVRRGFHAGWASFGRLLRLKALVLAMYLGASLLLATPAGLHLLGAVPKVAMEVATLVLALAAVPVLLTLLLASKYAVRICALEGKGAVQSLGEARGFLSGRIRDSLQLLLVTVGGQLAGAAAGLVVALPAAAIGVAVYFLAGLLPAVIIGGVLAVPFITAIIGATGAFQSATWTLAYLEGRAQETA